MAGKTLASHAPQAKEGLKPIPLRLHIGMLPGLHPMQTAGTYVRVAIGPGGPNPRGFGPGLGQIFGENSYIGPARLAQDLGRVLLGGLSGARQACPSPGAPGPWQSSASLRSQESGTQALRDQFTSHSQPHTTQATHSSDPPRSTILLA
ncbi:hypothetical protein PCASD_11435 [Puccinia coronata f. sp. avenae]|uniref:Uncharacterized protein n=1 Tax=Puccinia coronata f. sp. avenae TaxID=200324 RepID=A0A2N5V0S6_9BASI|nr:hypothetical protein PCASD_11435 [Puccinia coronata f. sp. avenae]